MQQDSSKLTPDDLELIRVASEHGKKRYNAELTTIAAALRTKNGKIYTGTNLKYRVRNTSTCAGATAIHTALNEGETEFDTIVEVKYVPEARSFTVVHPCGQCRQLQSYNLPLRVIVDHGGTLEGIDAEQLLPYPF